MYEECEPKRNITLTIGGKEVKDVYDGINLANDESLGWADFFNHAVYDATVEFSKLDHISTLLDFARKSQTGDVELTVTTIKRSKSRQSRLVKVFKRWTLDAKQIRVNNQQHNDN